MGPNTEVDNSLRDLHNSSHHKKAKFNKMLYYSFKIFLRFEPRSHLKGRLRLIVRVNVVLNRTVVVDSD